MDFAREHRQTLLHSKYIPHHPELNYPVIEAASDKERIVAVYSDCAVAEISGYEKNTIILNATGQKKVFLKAPAGKQTFTAYDCFGIKVGRVKVSGLCEVEIPVGGYIITTD